jgi:hypothetical protein
LCWRGVRACSLATRFEPLKNKKELFLDDVILRFSRG